MVAIDGVDKSQSDKKGPGTNDVFADDKIDDRDPPSQKFINWFLQNADSTQVGSLLHRIGFNDGDVPSAKHTHDGKDSGYLFGSTPTSSDLLATATNAQIISAINVCLQQLRSRGMGQ